MFSLDVAQEKLAEFEEGQGGGSLKGHLLRAAS